LVLMNEFSALSIQALAVDLVISATRNTKAYFLRSSVVESRQSFDERGDEDGDFKILRGRWACTRTPFPIAKSTSNTIQHDLRQMRVRAACESLRSTDAPLAHVARACGFFDRSHFTRCFK